MDKTRMLAAIFQEKLNWHGARINFLANFIISILKVKTINLAEVASAFTGRSKIESKYKRIQRFFRSFHIDSNLMTKLIVSMLPIKEEKWILTMDRTNWKFGKLNINILVLGIAYKGIAFPLMWKFLDKKGNSNTTERIELLERFKELFSFYKIEFLTADREFIGEEWLHYLLDNNIHFRIRIRNNTKIPTTRGILVHAKNFF